MSEASRLNRIYWNMKTRCYNPKSPKYKIYGARGIKVCSEWLFSYKAFKEWANGNGYAEGLTLDRVNVDEGYCASNCRWVSMKEQQNNRRSNHYITYKGQTKTMRQWSEELNIPYSLINNRLWRGYSIERAFTQKLGKHSRKRIK